MSYQQLLRKVVWLGLAVLLLAACGGEPLEQVTAPTPNPPTPTPLTRLDGKNALFIVPDRFVDVEYRVPRRILEDLGAVVTVASWSLDEVVGSAGNAVQPELQLGDVCVEDFDAFVFVGGHGVRPTAPETQRVVQEAVAGGKVVAAICAAQGILTQADLLEGKRASVASVERYGRVIAASGPITAREFGETIATVLGE